MMFSCREWFGCVPESYQGSCSLRGLLGGERAGVEGHEIFSTFPLFPCGWCPDV